MKIPLVHAIRFLLFLILSAPVMAQDVSSVIAEAEKLEAGLNEKEALNKFKEALRIQPLHLHALTKCSELCSRIGAREKDHTIRDSYFKAAAIYAQTALKHFPKSDEAHVSMAIAIGRTALTKSGKEKIAQVKEIRHHAETALQLNHDNFKAWHIMGKWYYEISNLSMLEKAAIKVFYGGLPAASYKESINAYEKAKSIRPDFMLNYLELAKAYKKHGEKAKAIATLRIIPAMSIRTEDDARIKQESLELIKKWD